MTNYTYEQRKMIANYLNEKLLNCATNYISGFKYIQADKIEHCIKELNDTTFSDIKNQVGVKFKVIGCENESYAIGLDTEYQLYQLVNLETFKITDLSLISDDEKVEVINE